MTPPPGEVVAEVQVWRAAMQVDPSDRRPTGSPQLQKAVLTWQRALERRVTGGRTPALDEWGEVLRKVTPGILGDPFAAVLAERLAGLSRSGVDARALLADAVGNGPVPDDHAAAAVWWRISRHVAPAVAADGDPAHSLPTAWTEHLDLLLGPDRSQAVQVSTWWPALVTVVERGVQRGWPVDALLAAAAPGSTTGPTHGSYRDVDGDVDECLAMVWRASVLTDPAPVEPIDDVAEDAPPHDLWDGVDLSQEPVVITVDPEHIAPATRGGRARDVAHVLAGGESATPTSRETDDGYDPVSADLAVQARLRDLLGAPEPAPADIERRVQRATDLEFASVSRERAVHVNELTLAYYQARFHGSWAQQYLHDRFAHDLTGDPAVRPGYAPDGWTGLVDHLRRQGVSEEEMLAAGVASTASTGRLIDRFRDRAVLPITHAGDVLGFVGRRHPDHTDDDRCGPKYLNTATTVAYVKGDQLYVADPDGLAAGAVPVLVEGPMDAIAVTLATAGSHVGVAPLGTALTEQQAAQLAAVTARTGVQPVVATDADLAGRTAAERAYWTLALQALDPAVAALPAGADPADLYATTGPEPLGELLATARPLADLLVEERLAHLPADRALEDALAITATRPACRWPAAAAVLSQRLDRSRAEVDRQLLVRIRAWNADPRRATDNALQDVRSVRVRLQAANSTPPGEPDADVPAAVTAASAPQRRWYAVAADCDPRLVRQDDWPTLARLMQAAHDCGHDVPAATRLLVANTPLGNQPAQELRYRLLEHLDLDAAAPADVSRRRPGTPEAGLPMGPRPGPEPQPRR